MPPGSSDFKMRDAMTSGSLAAVRTPLHFASDRECIELLAATVGKFDGAKVTIGWIRLAMATRATASTAPPR